jgi:hypothetical protein
VLDRALALRGRGPYVVLLRRLGREDEGRHAYGRAPALFHDDAERRLLERRLAELGTSAGPARHAEEQRLRHWTRREAR